MAEISTKPYLLRAIYEWCTDNGYTPYIAAVVDTQTRVPREYVKNGEIVLNISFAATSGLKMDNDFVQFSARFGGVARDISVPVENVVAIYARENGQGMAFKAEKPLSGDQEKSQLTDATRSQPLAAVILAKEDASERSENSASDNDRPDPPKKSGGRPTLTRIK
jgi:stringent starvation protein B